jgi:hypothetical protein
MLRIFYSEVIENGIPEEEEERPSGGRVVARFVHVRTYQELHGRISRMEV